MNDDVLFADGTRGVLVTVPAAGGSEGMAEVLLDTGQTLFVPMDTITQHPAGGHRTAVSPPLTDSGDVQVIPLVAETLTVGTREIETGRVRFSTTVTERVETVDEPLFKTEVEVRRVAVGQFVDAPPAVRYEDGVMIVPVLEEVLVVEKRLRLKEEVYVSQKREEYRSPQQVTLRTETLSKERLPAETI